MYNRKTDSKMHFFVIGYEHEYQLGIWLRGTTFQAHKTYILNGQRLATKQYKLKYKTNEVFYVIN